MKNPLVCLVLIVVGIAATNIACAATIPAGTTLFVRTNAAISTHATPGRHFTATLDQNVGELRAGTQVVGLIQTSRGVRSTTSSSPLTLVLTGVSASGKTVKIKTSSVQPQGAHTTRQSRGSFSFGEDTFPAGTKLEFRLTQPFNL